MVKTLKAFLNGYSEVMLQENTITGILFLVGIFYSSWQMGVGSVLGDLVGMLVAIALKYDKRELSRGLYGYNGVLVGIAIVFFFGFNPLSVLFLILGSVLSSVVNHYMVANRIPSLTAPFVLSAWAVIVLALITGEAQLLGSVPTGAEINLTSVVSLSFAQVMFQASIVTGILFFLGVVFSTWRGALYALCSVVISTLLAYGLGYSWAEINFGLLGFNAVLCGIAFSTRKWYAGVLAVIFSVLIYLGLEKIHIPALTAPFVLATWLGMLMESKLIKKNYDQTYRQA